MKNEKTIILGIYGHLKVPNIVDLRYKYLLRNKSSISLIYPHPDSIFYISIGIMIMCSSVIIKHVVIINTDCITIIHSILLIITYSIPYQLTSCHALVFR